MPGPKGRGPSRPVVAKATGTLVLARSAGKAFTKSQLAFNRNLRRIETLRRRIAAETQRWADALAFYSTELHPLELRLDAERAAMVRRLWTLLATPKGIRATQKTRLFRLMHDVLVAIQSRDPAALEPDLVEILAFVSKASETPEDRRQFEEARAAMEREFEAMGIHVDFSRFHPGMSWAERERFAADVERQIDAIETDAPPAGGRRGTRSQRAREQREREKEELRRKDIGQLYKRLAKLIHPDLESDPAQRDLKEAAMKDLTTAYKSNDLHGLLRIELEWIQQAGAEAGRLSDEKLSLYNATLREQIGELEAELAGTAMNRRFAALWRYADPLVGLQPGDLHDAVEELTEQIAAARSINGRLAGDNARDELIALSRIQSN